MTACKVNSLPWRELKEEFSTGCLRGTGLSSVTQTVWEQQKSVANFMLLRAASIIYMKYEKILVSLMPIMFRFLNVPVPF